MVWPMLELRHGDACVTIDPDDGGRMLALTVGDLGLLRTPVDDAGGLHWGAFVMAPWAGRTRHGTFTFDGVEHHLPRNSGDHAIHGTVRNRPWTVDEARPDRVRLSCDFGPDWPFPGEIVHTITLHDDRLELTLSVHAREGRMPASVGWHPWWHKQLRRGGAAALSLPARSMFVRDDEGIALPTLVAPPPGPWDDCFTDLDGPPVLTWADALSLTIESDCRCVVVYDQPADSVCVEPQTAPPDALNGDPFVVEPDRPLVAHTTWSWQRSG
jgi:aldose 1-epimerase